MNKRHIFIILILLLSCASQRPPSGGPVDKTSPLIVEVIPQPNATQVSTSSKVEILFSERMEKKSVEDALFISPRSAELPSFKWSGQRLKIEFPNLLQENKTYVLTIGTDAVDLRRNRLGSSFHLAFSTGQQLDMGRISGNVYSSAGVEGIIVGAYGLNPDGDPDPARKFADYITQCTDEGAYQFSYISPGRYRLFAIGDRDRDLKYARGIESIGIPTTDVEISAEKLSVEDINFRVAIEDTVSPGIRSILDIDRHHLDVRFDEPVFSSNDSSLIDLFSISREKNNQDTLQILNAYANSADAGRIHLKLEAMAADTAYLLHVRDLSDAAGNSLDTSRISYSFNGNSIPDTTGPKLVSQSIKNGQKNLALNSNVNLIFSEAMDTVSLERHFIMDDSNAVAVDGNFQWKTPVDVAFVPLKPLQSMMKHRVRVHVDSVYDEFNNSLIDSSIAFEFETLNRDTLTAIAGIVGDENVDARGQFYLKAAQTSDSNVIYELVLDSTGVFRFDQMLPGIYLLNGFRDEDSSGNFSHGRATPFQPAERFLFYSDSIKIRSRWPSEGENLIFNKY